jgi:Tfp pilus assembly pilus retraction ATPase PilT
MNMHENDTLKLLRECDAGVKMGVSSINDVLPDVKAKEMREQLADCRNQHETLLADIKQKLCEHCDKGKEPAPAAKGMSWIKTNMKMAFDYSDKTIADLITDGCNMGVKSLNRYLNQYSQADSVSKGFANRLIKLEDDLAMQMRQYL